VDYGLIDGSEEDKMFLAGETDAELSQRCYKFLRWLGRRQESEVAIVCHSKFLFGQ
jgi:hypothetical protein